MTDAGSKKRNTRGANILLALLLIVLIVLPLYIAQDAEFGGVDGEAEEAIREMQPDYEPWFSPVFKPPSGEIESLLFVLQAAIGAGIIGYGFGFLQGRGGRGETSS